MLLSTLKWVAPPTEMKWIGVDFYNKQINTNSLGDNDKNELPIGWTSVNYHAITHTLSFARCSIVIGEATAANISEGRLSLLLLFLSASRLGWWCGFCRVFSRRIRNGDAADFRPTSFILINWSPGRNSSSVTQNAVMPMMIRFRWQRGSWFHDWIKHKPMLLIYKFNIFFII